MKARRVKHLDPGHSLAENAERIVRVRLEELCDFVPAVLDPSSVRELHDMRIAAKRLRYALEVTADPCFGPYARTASKRAKELQDLLGEIHDCDVQLPRVEDLVDTLRDEDAAELRRRAGDAPDLDPALASRLPAQRLVARPDRARDLPARAPRPAVRALHDVLARPRARGLPRPPGVRDRRAPRARAGARPARDAAVGGACACAGACGPPRRLDLPAPSVAAGLPEAPVGPVEPAPAGEPR